MVRNPELAVSSICDPAKQGVLRRMLTLTTSQLLNDLPIALTAEWLRIAATLDQEASYLNGTEEICWWEVSEISVEC